MERNQALEVSARNIVAYLNESSCPRRWDLILELWQQSQATVASTSVLDETGRIFLQEGFEAWVAYALLKYPTLLSTLWRKPKQTSTSLLEIVQQSSIDPRRRLAAEITNVLYPDPEPIDPPPIVTKFLTELGKRLAVDPIKMSHVGKRRRTGDIHDRVNPSIDFSPGHRVDPSALNNHPPPPHDTTIHYPTPNLSSRSPDSQANHDISWEGRIADPSLVECPPEDFFHTVENPSLEAVRLLFPEHIANTIEIRPHPTQEGSYISSLTMLFPGEKFRGICQIMFDVLESKLPLLAHKWFNTSVECDWRGGRYLSVENGRVKITPETSLSLEGMRKQMAEAEFGAEVLQAISATAIFQTETKMGLPTTSTVLLKIPNSLATKAQVQITLDEVRGTQIKRKLWKQ